MRIVIIFLYIGAIILANFIALWMGQPGIIITAFILIPFDFVLRSYFHETWKGGRLWRNLILLIGTGAVVSYLCNHNMLNIAIGSFTGFLMAGIVASLFYQSIMKRTIFLKVNGSDLVAIVVDSFIFQWIAFQDISLLVMTGQIGMKFLGGLLWYYILFYKLKINEKW